MANKEDYLTAYREFFEYFAQTVNPNDQLPVKLASYKLLNVEVVGGIIDWTTQYLTQKGCPPHLLSPLIKIIIEEIRKECKKQPVNHGFSTLDNAYEPLKLMQTVMAKTNEVCLRYLDNSTLCSLPTPNTTYYKTSIYAMRNKRRRMEDRHVVIHDLNTMFNIQEASPSSYYAIFDGHAGHDAAAYSCAHLHQFLAENKYFISNPEQALLDAFCKTDVLFLEKCKVENLSGGTTAVVALLRPKEKTLYIAWVGDSQALLVNQGKILQCVLPHKPCRSDERERIEKSGGCVMLWGTWRVNGQLAVSRAIGDADYKPHVIAIPDVREISLDGGEDFLILACDGLWDFVSEDLAAQEVYDLILENPDDTERIGKHLAQLSRYQGSADNISVVVVFLKEPHKIAAEAHSWATRNGPPLTTDNMEAGLENANNPFTNSNGSLKNLDVETDNLHLQKSAEGLLLNLTDNFKSNGTDLSQDIFVSEKSNGTKNSSSDNHFDVDDDFGPETNIDAIDDAFSPVETNKSFLDDLDPHKEANCEDLSQHIDFTELTKSQANNNPLEEDFNPFLDKEVANNEKKEQDFEEQGGFNRDETPTPPVDAINDAGGLEENPGDSDSEDEWNYIQGDQAKPENSSSQPETVVETSEQEDAMSQLNPNAAEFVPVSPTRSITSPVCQALIHDEVIAQSPKRPINVDINVPNENDFESEVRSRPSDFDACSNGHDNSNEHNTSGVELMENLLNGKSIDEIPEFHPGSTPTKAPPAEGFHFGPNAAPFTPKPLDQSEALSTKANFGDDTEQTLNTSFNESELLAMNKENSDPMSMSFYAERGEANPFQDDEDLNKVHNLPENLDEFLENSNAENAKETRLFDDTISDLPEHEPLGKPLDNDEAAIQTTDLDKLSQDDEKELASPLEPEQEDIVIAASSEEPLNENPNIAFLPELEPVSNQEPILECSVPNTQSEEIHFLVDVEAEVHSEEKLDVAESVSPLPQEVSDLLQSETPESESESVSESRSPVPQEDFEQIRVQPICQFPKEETLQPNVEVELIQTEESSDGFQSQGLVCELKQTLDDSVPESDEFVLKSDTFKTESNPKSEFEVLDASPSGPEERAVSPIPACEYSAEPSACAAAVVPESQSPVGPKEQLQEDDITSSVKDDISSPIEQLSPVKSPVPQVEDAFAQELINENLDQPSPVDEVQPEIQETSFSQNVPNQDLLFGFSCPLPSEPQHLNGLTSDLDSTALVSDVVNNEIPIKTDNIQPEFAKPAIITPSEESKTLDVVPQAGNIDQPPILSEPVLSPLPQVAEGAQAVPKKTSASQPKKPAAATSKSIVKTSASKSATTSKQTASTLKPSPKPAARSPKVPPSKTEKPLTNGDVKPMPIHRVAAKRPATETVAAKTTTRPTSTAAAPKPSSSRTAAPRPATAPRSTAPRPSTVTASKPSTTTATSKPNAATSKPASAAAAKPRVPLSHRTPAATRITTTSSANASKSTTAAISNNTSKTTTATGAKRTLLSPKTAPTVSAPSPKPRTITNATKPRVPPTKTVTKSAEVEKVKKETANKLTASRTTTVMKTTSATATSRTTSTTVKKTEVKPLSSQTLVSKTSTTKSTTVSKKPGEVKTPTKTKTTKIEKPKENGVAATTVTEEIKDITIVNNVVNETDSLVKDNYPTVDNKIITGTLIDANPAD